MMKYLLTTALVAVGVAAGAGSASAADKYTFALVPKNTNNPFFDQALAGCKKAEKELTARSSASISARASMAAATSRRRSSRI